MSLPDALAVLRALAALPIVWAITSGLRDLALAIFVVAAISDAVDGWLARRAGSLGLRGQLLDPIADKILVIGALVALAATGAGWPVTVVTVLVAVREGIVGVIRARAYARGIGLPADGVAKAKTVAEMAGVALIILGGRPWAVVGAAVVGLAVVVGFATLPRYLPSRAHRVA